MSESNESFVASTLCDVLEGLRAGVPAPPPASAAGGPRDLALAHQYCRSLRALVEEALHHAEGYRARFATEMDGAMNGASHVEV